MSWALLFRSFAGALVVLVGMAGLASAEDDDFSKVDIKAEKVAGNVYVLMGEGGNIGVSVGSDGIVIVDDEFAELAPKIKAALRGITKQPLRFVLNTHYHGDHTGANAAFSREATIIAHENVRRRLGSPRKLRTGEVRPPAPAAALPVITFTEGASVHFNGEEIRAIHVPHGHTDGDSIIYFVGSKVVHMGDDFVTYGYPFIDVDAGGSVAGLIDNLERALTLLPPEVKVIPGHGRVSTLEDVRRFRAMLKDSRDLVAQGRRQGKTLEQMQKAKLLARFDADWGKGFLKTDQWIETLYKDLDLAEKHKSAAKLKPTPIH